MNRVEQIRIALEQAFKPEYIDIEDDSASHAGHAGARDGKGHFNVVIVSTDFEAKSLIQRHRMVYKALSDLLETDIHALSIQAFTPNQFSAV
jgi:BolA protein